MRPFPSSPIWRLLDRLGDATAIPEQYSKHALSIQVGFYDHTYTGQAKFMQDGTK